MTTGHSQNTWRKIPDDAVLHIRAPEIDLRCKYSTHRFISQQNLSLSHSVISLLQFSVSHDLLEIITIYLTLKKHFWLLSMLKTILLLHILCGNGDTLYFSGFSGSVCRKHAKDKNLKVFRDKKKKSINLCFFFSSK